jgi:hypothetical protein
MSHQNRGILSSGDNVVIRRGWRSPHAGRSGVLSAIEPNDPYGAYLVHFDDGTEFRYGFQELEALVAPPPHFFERAVRVLSELGRSLRA